MAAIDAIEIDFPSQAKREGQVGHRAFGVAGLGYSLAILYAREPHMDDGSMGIHFSVTKCFAGKPTRVEESDLNEVYRILRSNGLEWPAPSEVHHFHEPGPFQELGVHVWEI